MTPESDTDHVALLALGITGVLIHRLNELGQLDEPTSRQLGQLVRGVRLHAERRGLADLHVLFDNLERALRARASDSDAN